MTEENEDLILQIDNVRILRSDALNVVLEREELIFNRAQKKDIPSYQFKGYHSSTIGALRDIVNKELLIDERSVTDLKDFCERIEESNNKIQKVIDNEFNRNIR